MMPAHRSTMKREETDSSSLQSLDIKERRVGKEDPTGRDRLVSNILFNWGGHFVYIVAGFVMPRMIDQRLGQECLGIWDFAWSLVNYFELVRLGIGSSVNRYVARYRGTGDIAGVNRVVSSATFLMAISGLLVLAFTMATVLLLPRFFGTRLGDNVQDAQWVVCCLGGSICVEVSLGAFSGVLTGCHRWGIQNLNRGGWYAAIVVGMIAALLLGGGLRALSIVTLIGTVLGELTRLRLAHLVCPGLCVRLSSVQGRTIRELLAFGGKTLIPSVSQMLLNQATSIVIVAYLGPAALALYSRPRSLIYHTYSLVNKMAMVLIPTVSSLQSIGDSAEIRDLVLKSVRCSTYMALPMVLVLAIFGDAVMHLWMGVHYANGTIPAVLAIGYLASMAQLPAWNILMGLDAHGRAGMAMLVAAICSVGLSVFSLAYLKMGLVGAALAVVLPLTVANAIYLPFLTCRRVGLSVRTYFFSAVSEPMLRIAPFALCLAIARFVFQSMPLTGVAIGAVAGGAVLGGTYWKYVLPDRIKARFLSGGYKGNVDTR